MCSLNRANLATCTGNLVGQIGNHQVVFDWCGLLLSLLADIGQTAARSSHTDIQSILCPLERPLFSCENNKILLKNMSYRDFKPGTAFISTNGPVDACHGVKRTNCSDSVPTCGFTLWRQYVSPMSSCFICISYICGFTPWRQYAGLHHDVSMFLPCPHVNMYFRINLETFSLQKTSYTQTIQ